MEKQATIAETMRQFMATGPSVQDFPSYKSLNDHIGAVHGLAEGKCQALAGPKAWAWHPDTELGVWRPATAEEIEAKQAAAAGKASGGSRKKVLSEDERTALVAQIKALEAIDNPALVPLLADLRGKQAADDAARKGSLKDRLNAVIDKLGLVTAVTLLEAAAENA